MPLKGFKGFTRRKSFGNVLDEPTLDTRPVSSFRVLERPHEPSKSFDGGHSLLRAAAEARPVSAGRALDTPGGHGPANRASHATQNSSSSTGPYQSSSSARSTSTLPSATSLDQAQEELYDRPIAAPFLPHTNTAPPTVSFRGALGLRKSTLPQPVTSGIHLPQQQHDGYHDIPDVRPTPRQRATTDTSMGSESTTTPSGFLVTDFGLKGNNSNDDFSNMFSNLSTEKRVSPKLRESPATMGPRDGNFFASKSESPSRPPLGRAANSMPVSPAPPSVGSTDSKTNTRGIRRKPSPSPHSALSAEAFANQRGTPSPVSSGASQSPHQTPNLRGRSLIPSARTPSPGLARQSSDPLLSFADEDMALAMQYIEQAEPSPPPRTFSPVKPLRTVYSDQPPTQAFAPPTVEALAPATDNETASQDAPATDSAETNSILMTPKLGGAEVEPEGSINDDASMQEIALYAERLETERAAPAQFRPRPITTGKVMTPAQFERYKKEQEQRQLVEGSDSEEEKDDSDKEDDDEAEEERNREMARQRRKQEADLAVYRQKMMKITGEPTTQRPPTKEATSSTDQIPTFSFGDKLTGSGANSEEEDEEVPLGILAAHGFPNKTRPPSHMDPSGRTSVQYKSETYPAPPQSVSGASVAGASVAGDVGEKSKGLPAFAKNLPKDPFFGASLVTPADRQSLAFGTGTPAGAGSHTAGPPPAGGLVGVIAKEERARALRRGSPNAGGFEASNAASGLSAPPSATPGLPPAMSPDQHAQMQLTQQMQQMMQMQMQWMQQMMTMQQSMGHAAPSMPPMPGMPGMPGMMPMASGSRPVSSHPTMANHPPSMYGALHNGGGQRQSTQRPTVHAAQSTPNLVVPGSGLPAGYATSLAPSERSSVGQPSRYRPVSSNVTEDVPPSNQRSSTMGARGLDTNGHRPNGYRQSTMGGTTGTSPKSSSPLRDGGTSPGPGGAVGTTPRATLKAVPRAMGRRAVVEDDDDDAGWAAMQAARDRKRGTWKSRTDSRLGHAPEDAGLEGLVGVMHYPME